MQRFRPLYGTNKPSGQTEDLEDLYENAPCGYLSIQADGRVFKVNRTLLGWLGYTSDDLVGRHFNDLITVAGRIFFETHIAPLLRLQGFFNEIALDLRAKDGTRLPVLLNAAERRDADGAHLFTRLTVFNATDRRRYERELVAAREASEAAQRLLETMNQAVTANLQNEQSTSALREQFIAVLGHDLRNPLAAIDGAAYMLAKTPLNDRAIMLVGMVRQSVSRMAGLIENVMDFARGRLGGGLTLDLEPNSSIEAMLSQVVAELQTNMPDRSVKVSMQISVLVTCDTKRIGQLASNLLANALTHGAPEQPVAFHAKATNEYFELSVANSGTPIPADILATIFEPFSRGDGRASKQGLGLGLYISNEIAKAHGGSLEVLSTPAETRFTFRMPLTANLEMKTGDSKTQKNK